MMLLSTKRLFVLGFPIVLGATLVLTWFLFGMQGNIAAAALLPSHTPTVDPEPIGHVGGMTQAIFVSDTLIYVGNGSELSIMDVTDPNSPIEIGDIWWKEGINDIWVRGNYAYLAMNNGLRIVDVSDPALPTLINSYITDSVRSLEIKDSQVYLGTYSGKMQILDITDPLNLVYQGEYVLPYQLLDMALVSHYAYIAVNHNLYGGVYIIDVTNPTTPTLQGIYTANIGRMTVVNDLLFLASVITPAMSILDVSTPITPVEIGSFEMSSVYWYTTMDDIAVQDGIAYLSIERLSTDGYSFPQLVITAVDVNDPTSPQELFSESWTEYFTHAPLTVSGNYVYLADGASRLLVVDATLPATPTVSTHLIGLPDLSMEIQDQFLYATTNWGDLRGTIFVIDISIPTDPEVVEVESLGDYSLNDLSLDGNYAYSIFHSRHFDGLFVIDITDPLHLTKVGFYSYPDEGYTHFASTMDNANLFL